MASTKPVTPKTRSKPSSKATKKPVGSTQTSTAQAGEPSVLSEMSTTVLRELAQRELARRELAATRKRVLDELWEVHRRASNDRDHKIATSALYHISRITGL